jgi:hypothetical protein
MLRPLALDLLWPLATLAVGALALALGIWSFRWPRKIRYGVIALAVAATAAKVTAVLVAAVGEPIPVEIGEAAWMLGGPTVIFCCMALFLLGVVWAVPCRRWSSGFLLFLAAVASGLMLTEAGACLW